jgi:RNA polymerase sigma factor (sigma-70 family)
LSPRHHQAGGGETVVVLKAVLRQTSPAGCFSQKPDFPPSYVNLVTGWLALEDVNANPAASVVGVERSEDLGWRAASSRDDEEFEEFFDMTWSRMVLMATRMGLSREDAEDVALDSMAVTYDRWSRVRILPYRQGWALKVMANRALRQLKRSGRRAITTSGPPASFEEEVTTRLALRKGIAGLPRRQRQVLALRYLADMPEGQVAQVLGLDIGTVKQHASRGRVRLQDTLNPDIRGGGDAG